jgi:hypothetical protein
MEVANILESIAIIIAAISVALGVNAWRREHVGRRRIELAEDVLSYFYEAQDIIKYIRSPLAYAGEGRSRKADPNETEGEKKIYDSAYVVIERYENKKEVFNKLKTLQYRFKVYFGTEKVKPFHDLRNVLSELLSSARMLSRLWLEEQRKRGTSDEKRFEELREQIAKYEAIFWEGPEEEDPIEPRVTELIREIENTCKSFIEKEPASLLSILYDR